MLEQEALDAVSVAKYAPAHAEITVGCAARGVRAISREAHGHDAARRRPHARGRDAAGALLVINHQGRFNPNYRARATGSPRGASAT